MQNFGCSSFSVILAACCVSFSTLSQTADSFVAQPDRSIYCLALQPDGKVLVGGDFHKLGGDIRPGFARLNTDGSLDPGFTPGFSAGYFLLIQPDGRIMASGARVAQLNTDGTLHGARDMNIDGEVRCLALQPDGKALIGGFFSRFGGLARTNIARLNPDWTVDTNFNSWADSEVVGLAQQRDGKILMGGYFSVVNGQPAARICRLNDDGTLDSSFSASASGTVYALAIQPDGKVLAGGYFTNLDGLNRTSIGRLNPDGTLDTNFVSAIVDPASAHVVTCLALQTDGRILVAGLFGTMTGPGTNLCRLNPDGSVDNSFTAQVSPFYDEVDSVALQADGRLVAVGSFRSIGGLPRASVGRLVNTRPATQSLSFNGSTITWARGATSPEVWRTRFALSTDRGKTWTKLGDGARIAGGWRLGGLSLPLNATIRARGFTANSFVETMLGPPMVLENPVSITRAAGTAASFTVYAAGTEPLSYQWRKNGAPLPDGVNVSGARTRTLVLPKVLGAHTGNYAVVISNSFGSVTSAVATLKVQDPVVSLQPASVIRQIGEDTALNVEVIGTPPFTYQWRKNGKPLAGASEASLLFSNLQSTDAAVYDAVINSAWGGVTSMVALLTINLASADSVDPEATGQWGGSVAGLAVQPDGRILVSGSFHSIAGQNYTNIARLNPDGTLDANFNPGAYGVNGGGPLMLMPDGKIMAGGDKLVRLDGDGKPDPSLSMAGAGSLLLLPAGKFLAGGYFDVSGNPNVVRFNSDGSPDPTFTPGAFHAIHEGLITMAAQPDGKLVVGGYYTRRSEVNEDFGFLVRVDGQGRPDTNFNAAVVLNLVNPEQITHVESVAVQADGKILVGGSFGWIGGQYRTNLARLNHEGTADVSFHPNPDGTVTSIALQANGKIVVGGFFDRIGGECRTNLARLYPDGTVDPTFNPGLQAGEWYPTPALALQADGKILVGGSFTNLAGQPRMNIGRLNNNDPATESFSFDGSVLKWLRGGSSPEVWATTFAYTTNGGVTWTELGRGTRVPGGWQVARVAAPIKAAFRGRGYFSAGLGNRSSSLVESFTGPAGIYTQPVSITKNAGSAADFYVQAGGAGTMAFQWRKDGKDLVDGGNVSGAVTDHLTLTSLLNADSGTYSAVFTYGGGNVTSSAAALTVVDPAINIQPLNRVTNIGCSLVLNPSTAGTPPLYYQWWKDGTAKRGATQQSLLLTQLQLSDAGNYVLVVSNALGIAISTGAVVSVQAPAADSFNPGAADPVGCLALEPDGRILVAGAYGAIERFAMDGAPDRSFTPDTSGGANQVNSLTVEPDGKILAAGSFSTIAGRNRNDIARFNSAGSIDTLDPNYLAGTVYALLGQPDGKLMVGGYFSTSPQNIGKSLARFNPDGSLDTDFDPSMNDSYAEVDCLLYQPDGKVLVAGKFTTIAGQARTNLARLNPDGSLDVAFNAPTEDPVTSVALYADGRILAATTSPGVFHTHTALKRLNPDGTLDASFNAKLGDYSRVGAIALQTDGDILIGGYFTMINGTNWGNLARLNPDGSLDMGFSPQAVGSYYSAVTAIAVQPDGRILVGGSFSSLAGQSRTNIARLKNDEPATQSLGFDGDDITWLRGGASPEIWRASFQYSLDGSSWVSVGEGTRIPGGWRLSGVSLPAASLLRARGFIQNGTGSWFMESQIIIGAAGRPFILADTSLGLQTGSFGFKIRGAPGQVVVIEASENLTDWSPIGTLTLSSAPQQFSDPAAPASCSRFYRLHLAQ
jgi:uncharacterized delta-60 repeat protein